MCVFISGEDSETTREGYYCPGSRENRKRKGPRVYLVNERRQVAKRAPKCQVIIRELRSFFCITFTVNKNEFREVKKKTKRN